MEFLIFVFIIISIISNASKKKKHDEAAKRAREQAQQMGTVQQKSSIPTNTTARNAGTFSNDPRFPNVAPVQNDPRFPNVAPVKHDPRFPDINNMPRGEGRGSVEGRRAPAHHQNMPPMPAQYNTHEGQHAPVHHQNMPPQARVMTKEGIGSHEGHDPYSHEGRSQLGAHKAKQDPVKGAPIQTPKQTITTRLKEAEGRSSALGGSMLGDLTSSPIEQKASMQSAAAYGLSFDNNSVVQGFLYGEILGKPKAMRR